MKAVVWRDQQLQPQLNWLYSLRPKIVSSLSGKCGAANAIFSEHVVSAVESMKLKNQTGIRTFSLVLRKMI